MSDDNFLSRWSRRKRAEEISARSPAPADEQTTPPTAEQAVSPAADAGSESEDEFDLSSLPSIESITSGTDVSVFLRKGVPLELSRAALRRAWTSDPGIRDFVGLAENAWDFNDPNAMPGFGPLDHSPEQVSEMVRQAFGEVSRGTDAIRSLDAETPVPAEQSVSLDVVDDSSEQSSPDSETAPSGVSAKADDTVTSSGDEALELPGDKPAGDKTIDDDRGEFVRRTHGGALPR
jgi:hypothetical protein